MAKMLRLPTVWSENELERDRGRSIQRFVAAYAETTSHAYREWYGWASPIVMQVFEETDMLCDVQSAPCLTKSFGSDEIAALRHCAGPPLSADSFKVITNALIEAGSERSAAVAETVLSMLDAGRFPWVGEGRRPCESELAEAVHWTSGLLATQKTQTEARTTAAARQESSVKSLLDEMGFVRDGSRGPISMIDDMNRGSYRNESDVVGSKCDVPVRLKDGRLMLVECKVSNSTTNSTKRLIREVCGKAPSWHDQFGQQAFVCSVIDGVFSLKNLCEAQDVHGVYLFWEMRLEDLKSFLASLED